MRRPGRWVGLVVAVLIAGAFAYLNAGERVVLNLGFTVVYRFPLVALVFGAFLLGMLTMFLVGLRHDLRIRRLLREHELAERSRRSWRSEPPPDHFP